MRYSLFADCVRNKTRIAFKITNILRPVYYMVFGFYVTNFTGMELIFFSLTEKKARTSQHQVNVINIQNHSFPAIIYRMFYLREFNENTSFDIGRVFCSFILPIYENKRYDVIDFNVISGCFVCFFSSILPFLLIKMAQMYILSKLPMTHAITKRHETSFLQQIIFFFFCFCFFQRQRMFYELLMPQNKKRSIAHTRLVCDADDILCVLMINKRQTFHLIGFVQFFFVPCLVCL